MIFVLEGLRAREETSGFGADHHGRVVLIRREHVFAVLLEGVLDHLEQRLRLLDTVDGPVGVEDLVTTVFGVRLGEHIQLDVVRVAPQTGEAADQVVDFIFRQRQPQLDVGLFQRSTTAGQNVDHGMW